jgi:hypothetical protein
LGGATLIPLNEPAAGWRGHSFTRHFQELIMRARLDWALPSRHSLGIVSLVLLAASPHRGAAQAGPSVAVGATVRAQPTGPGARWVQGQLVALTPDSVTIRMRQGDDTVALATSTLARLQVSQGRRAQTIKGALIGLGVGAGAGLVLGLALKSDNCTNFCEIEVTTGAVLAVTALGGGLGAGVGALIGTTSHAERWQPVNPSHSALRRGPTVKRAAVGLRVWF